MNRPSSLFPRRLKLKTIIVLLYVFQAIGTAQTLEFESFTTLPSQQGWTYYSNADNSESEFFSIKDSMLVQNTYQRGNYWAEYMLPLNSIVNPDTTWSLRVRARVIKVEDPNKPFGYFFNVSHNENVFGFQITETEINIKNINEDIRIGPFDNTVFHDYVLNGAPDGSWTLFVDNEKKAEGVAVPFAQLSTIPKYDLAFGDGTQKDNANAHGELASYFFKQYRPFVKAEFIADTLMGEDSLLVHFTDYTVVDSLDSILTWAWDFDSDGIIDSDEQNPAYLYDSPGFYSVGLSVSSSKSFDYVFKKNYIKVYSKKPNILSITDIPNDQGGWVKVRFQKSILDDDTLTFSKSSSARFYTVEIKDGDEWLATTTNVAYGKDIYSVLVPTIRNKTPHSDGILEFRVIAAMDEGNFVSDIETGYSEDNLKPEAPDILTISVNESSNIQLEWTSSKEADLKYYSVYRGTNGVDYSLIAQTSDTLFIDSNFARDTEYFYVLTATDFNGNESIFSSSVNTVVSNLGEDAIYPNRYFLGQNYPNPFNPTTKIKYGLKTSGKVRIIVTDISGRLIKELVNEEQSQGEHIVLWDGKNRLGNRVGTGVYFYILKVKNGPSFTKKMILIK